MHPSISLLARLVSICAAAAIIAASAIFYLTPPDNIEISSSPYHYPKLPLATTSPACCIDAVKLEWMPAHPKSEFVESAHGIEISVIDVIDGMSVRSTCRIDCSSGLPGLSGSGFSIATLSRAKWHSYFSGNDIYVKLESRQAALDIALDAALKRAWLKIEGVR